MSSADLQNLDVVVVVAVVVAVVASINGLLDGFEINFPSDDVTSVSKIEKPTDTLPSLSPNCGRSTFLPLLQNEASSSLKLMKSLTQKGVFAP